MDILNKVEVLDKANYFALIEGKQIMFFTTRKQGEYLILWCKAEGTSSKYKLSEKGKKYSDSKNFDDKSPYIGKITYLSFNNNNLNLWQELYDKQLFSLWDPTEGPFLYNETNLKRIAICQVFKTNIVIGKDDIGAGRTSRKVKNYEKVELLKNDIKNIKPVMPHHLFLDKKMKIETIMNKYK